MRSLLRMGAHVPDIVKGCNLPLKEVGDKPSRSFSTDPSGLVAAKQIACSFPQMPLFNIIYIMRIKCLSRLVLAKGAEMPLGNSPGELKSKDFRIRYF